MKKKKLLCLGLTAMLAVSSLAGCGSSESKTTESQKKEESDTVKITYWGWDNNFTEPMKEAFEKANPGYELEVTAVAYSDYVSKIQQSAASGAELPDILIGESNLRGPLFQMDIWEDLSQEPYHVKKEDYFDYSINKSMNEKGEILGIEQSVSPSAMAYKRSVAAEYFGTDDRAELEQKLATMEDYEAAAKEVQEKSDGKVFLFNSAGSVLGWLYTSDTKSLVSDDGSLDFTGKMKPLLETACKLRDAGAIDNFTADTPQANAAYAGENHILYPCPNWGISNGIKANDPDGSGNWGMMIPPTGGYSNGGTIMGISKSSKNKEAAWKFIDWCTNSDEGVKAAKEQVSYYVPAKKYYEDNSYTTDKDTYFKGQDIGELLYQEVLPNIEVPSVVTPYDSVVQSEVMLLAQAMMADKSMTWDQLLEKGLADVQSKLPDVTVK
ncbi:ABC transporter substrate-binding protein [uncultured Robinsoniella sp.]|uniref:ABC transporter substrate-binding protein n=1 Tax=uncultured Robinsoniella sp. TaxID=904190 RepID=UPI00374F2F2F